ncbi:hypothetical protein DFH07DRAFT_1059276 [Mycena maculata]|uniref:VWFA domain-containing protein n=1 Tax=Mycena maculata TaxID=230809 RepID=A0AAD7JIT3_9AGAR|nr:hypothetical protein DFH07DRAFT_1059276 [Mycena maculata]
MPPEPSPEPPAKGPKLDDPDAMDVDPVTPKAEVSMDLLHSIQGMYRVLDLITESGSGGLVDKIIIAQDSLKELINMLSPGAYASLIKVDFNALDKVAIKPLGLYGSKSEIIAFLSCRGVINQETARALNQSTDNPSVPHLRSGLYVLRACNEDAVEPKQIFVIYWPEPTTWDDDAISSVRRNRVTFMRYLTKIADQLTCLVSPEHARAIVWNEEPEDLPIDLDEESDRLFTFEVAKTNEQEENVTVRPGFTMNTPILAVEKPHMECTMDASELQPTLVHGETAQTIMTKRFVPSKSVERIIRGETHNAVQLRNFIGTGPVRLSPTLTDEGINILMEHGLESRCSVAFKAWKSRNKAAKESIDAAEKKEVQETKQKLTDDSPQSEPMLREVIVDRLLAVFPTVHRSVLSSSSDDEINLHRTQYESLVGVHTKFKDELERAIPSPGDRLGQPKLSAKFKTLKEQLLCIDIVLKDTPDLELADRQVFIECISKDGMNGLSLAIKARDSPTEGKGIISRVTGWFSDEHWTPEQKIRHRVRDQLVIITDFEILSRLDDMLAGEPLLQDLITRTVEEANSDLQGIVKTLLGRLVGKSVLLQHETFKGQIHRKCAGLLEDQRKDSRLQLIEEYERDIAVNSRTLIFEGVERCKQGFGTAFKISGSLKYRTEPIVECKLHAIQLTTDDQHTLQLESTFVPSPHMKASSAEVFNVQVGQRILHAQLLESGKLLLIIETPEVLYIYLESPAALENAVSRGRASAKRVLHRDKIGKEVLLAYDEQKRMLSLCETSKLLLHIYVFDETFNVLQAWGSSLDLKPWYAAGTFVSQSCFVSGSEEILFLDTSGQARIFSLITQQFRPASLALEKQPDGLYSSPDGACLLLSFREPGDNLSFRAYHWSTFGSSQGIDLGTLDLPDASATLTSLVNRRNVHLVGIDTDAQVCQSVVLDITKKTTEFMFKETGVKTFSKSSSIVSAHNSLIDCYADVWTRFPVVAAVQRKTIVSSVDRRARKLVFVTDRDHDRFAGHFSELIITWEQRTKKPGGETLKRIQVSALPSSASFFSERSLDAQWDLSLFRAGEWLVDLLCLIPIQIAVTKENRFVPLKDGVVSTALEQRLLGADVNQIVDSLTFSWMESVFQSYMTSKPVKVVSSMGEQSVGKSFSLNHLADTSFAGSAMRTTEGVWMSVTPTEDSLLVALDFEGVHSIERSAQEDTLLVLFNTAISNLVLFRNNFAMSRSISGLFQSFQSSSTVLDPAANPTLFRSTLTIIIKDVVESDKNEIVREFSTKFQKIVEDEQDANFISRLHAGQLNIVPWPVIESKQFYTLFPAVKRLLDKQEVTHRTAGEFLHTLKTLMAKLKANDWGSLSQTLVAHRAQKLLGGLTNALAFGVFELDPDNEPLKNFDTDQLIEKPDTPAQFFLSSADSPVSRREEMLIILQHSWDQFAGRATASDVEWTGRLSAYLNRLAEMRIQHVYEWISSNISRFKSSHANIEMLRRVFETAIVDLRANVEVCGSQCAHCQLKCLLSRRHDSSIPHDCRTSHQCVHPCDFGDEHPATEKTCGLPAGHAARHICAIDIHLCGEPCGLKDKQGCLGSCMKVVGHVGDDHMCSARLHKCGEPCDLKNLKVPGTKSYSCPKTCAIASDEPHTQHVCDSSACPVRCELCERLCSNDDHLHGLETDADHLCGQTHNCAALCQADGTCEIETAPQSIEATFTGRHETFQYTKYSQVAKRLPCVFPIPPGEKQHSGPHNHSTDPTPFHFCETRCESCGYYCTLPRGHPQQEHETHHGSMSKTRWAVDGPDGTILELNGRKFGADDDGAPMMCNLVCQEMGRHVHVDYCRADDAASCDGPEVQHLKTRMTPNPSRAKDWISHSLFWRRTGFKDPYSRPDQVNFGKCDAMCPDTEHAGTATTAAHPSYCTLPLFHPRATQAAGLGYLSNDGHVFNCKNPSVMQQAFHVIFVIDRSGSMGCTDREPLRNAPGTALISRSANNRLGAVYSALHGFWMSRNTALNNSGGQGAAGPVRRDAYSVVLFDHTVSTCIANDFTNTPDQLLTKLLAYQSGGGTNFTLAIKTAEAVMRQHWSTERTPVVIFLSDGECSIADETVRSLSRNAVALGKPLSFHSVSFGSASQSAILRRMAQVALEVQNGAPRDPLVPAEATINSSYSEALDTVRLAETFLGFAESLRKPRGALFSSK